MDAANVRASPSDVRIDLRCCRARVARSLSRPHARSVANAIGGKNDDVITGGEARKHFGFALVTEVLRGSPAERAGVRAGDRARTAKVWRERGRFAKFPMDRSRRFRSPACCARRQSQRSERLTQADTLAYRLRQKHQPVSIEFQHERQLQSTNGIERCGGAWRASVSMTHSPI